MSEVWEQRKENDTSFVSALNRNMYQRTPEYYKLRKMFGQKAEDDLSAYMAVLNMGYNSETGENIINSCGREDVYFLVATMFCFMERPESDGPYVRVDKLIGRLYRKNSASTNKEIAALLNLNYGDGFRQMFVRLMRRLKHEMRPDERIDYVSLLSDLRSWNNVKTRQRWARNIVSKELKSA